MTSCVVCTIVDQQKLSVARAVREGLLMVEPAPPGSTMALLVEHAAIVIRQYLVLGIALERKFPTTAGELCEMHAADVTESFRDPSERSAS